MPCSYYDLFMRFCVKSSLENASLPPSVYTIQIAGALSAVECNKFYPLTISGNYGTVAMIAGAGEYLPSYSDPSQGLVDVSGWMSPSCGHEGTLVFEDENGARGCIDYRYSPAFVCDSFEWYEGNPEEIDPATSKTVYVDGGVSPYTWSISGFDFSLSHEETTGVSNSLYAGGSSCGSAWISVVDSCGNVCSGSLRAPNGKWEFKSYACELNVCAKPQEYLGEYPATYYNFCVIRGGMKLVQVSRSDHDRCASQAAAVAQCEARKKEVSGAPECVDCMHPWLSCEYWTQYADPFIWYHWRFFYLHLHDYYEWVCP